MDFGLAGKTALVAAGSQGLGFGCAQTLAAEGCHVAICGRTQDKLDAAVESLRRDAGGKVAGFAVDVTDRDAVTAMVGRIEKQLGAVDVLVTNAGGPPVGPAMQMTLDQLDRAIDLNCHSAIHLINLCVPGMLERRFGRIVAITSISVRQPMANMVLSNASRAALTAYLKTLSVEVAPQGVTVNSVQPGFHETARIRSFLPPDQRDDPQALQAFLDKKAATIPTHAVGRPDDFGAAVAFLCSQQARFITGVNLPIDGGAFPGLL